MWVVERGLIQVTMIHWEKDKTNKLEELKRKAEVNFAREVDFSATERECKYATQKAIRWKWQEEDEKQREMENTWPEEENWRSQEDRERGGNHHLIEIAGKLGRLGGERDKLNKYKERLQKNEPSNYNRYSLRIYC